MGKIEPRSIIVGRAGLCDREDSGDGATVAVNLGWLSVLAATEVAGLRFVTRPRVAAPVGVVPVVSAPTHSMATPLRAA